VRLLLNDLNKAAKLVQIIFIKLLFSSAISLDFAHIGENLKSHVGHLSLITKLVLVIISHFAAAMLSEL